MRGAATLAAAAAVLLAARGADAADPGRIGYIMAITQVTDGRYCVDFSPYVGAAHGVGTRDRASAAGVPGDSRVPRSVNLVTQRATRLSATATCSRTRVSLRSCLPR
jgi:hypothetical protein